VALSGRSFNVSLLIELSKLWRTASLCRENRRVLSVSFVAQISPVGFNQGFEILGFFCSLPAGNRICVGLEPRVLTCFAESIPSCRLTALQALRVNLADTRRHTRSHRGTFCDVRCHDHSIFCWRFGRIKLLDFRSALSS
jgi:hypothetical protein